MRFNISYVLGLLMLLTIACNPAKKGSSEKLRSKSSSFILKRLAKQSFSADWLAAKGKITIGYEGQSISASLSLRMQKDKAIWAQVKKLSFEVGRLMITPDSLFLVDRFNKQYLATEISELARFTSAPIDFQMIQNLLFGRPYFWSSDNFSSDVKKDQYQLTQEWQRTKSKYLVDGLNFLLAEQTHQLDEYGADISASQGAYPSNGLSNFPYFRSYKIEGPAAVDLDLNFSKVNIDETQEFPFSIPSHYTPLPLN